MPWTVDVLRAEQEGPSILRTKNWKMTAREIHRVLVLVKLNPESTRALTQLRQAGVVFTSRYHQQNGQHTLHLREESTLASLQNSPARIQRRPCRCQD